MKRLKHLLEERARISDEMNAIMAKCEKENRSRSADEKTKWNGLKSQVDDLQEEITDLQAQQEIDMRTAKPQGENHEGEEVEQRTFVDKARTIAIIDSKRKLSRKEDRKGLSLGKLVIARIRGPQNELEERALSTSLDASGGISTTVSRNFRDLARAASTVVRAGASFLDFENGDGGIVKIPQITGDPTATWKVQNVEGALSDPSFTAKTFDFKTLFAATQLSNELVQDGGSLLAKMIETSLAKSFGVEIDRAALLGSGVGQEPEGLALKAINEYDMGASAGDCFRNYAPLIDAVKLNMDDNIPVENMSGFIMAPRTWAELANLREDNGQPLLIPDQIKNIPWYASSKIPVDQDHGTAENASSLYVGDWSQLVIGTRLNLKIRFHEQPLAQSFSTLVTAATRVDFEVMNLGAFCKIEGIIPFTPEP